MGAFLGLLPFATLLASLTWAGCLVLWRYVSLSSIIAALSVPVWAGMLNAPPSLIALSALAAVMVVLRHRDNLKRLLDGQEPKTTWPQRPTKADEPSA